MTVRKSATDNGFIIFKDQLSLLKLIPDEQLGKSIKLLLENFDDLPELDDISYEMFATNVRRYREQAVKSRENGLRGGNPTLKGTDNPTLKLQEKKRKENKKQDIKENLRKEKRVLVEEGQFYIDDTMPEYKDVLKGMNQQDVERCWKWIFDNFYGKQVDVSWVKDRIQQFKGGIK